MEPSGEAPETPLTEQNQSLAPTCPAGYTPDYVWQCRMLARWQAPCYYSGGPGAYNVEHLYCQSGSTVIDAGPTGLYACGDCW